MQTLIEAADAMRDLLLARAEALAGCIEGSDFAESLMLSTFTPPRAGPIVRRVSRSAINCRPDTVERWLLRRSPKQHVG